jgi:uncharacterized delta-60 repeat protein
LLSTNRVRLLSTLLLATSIGGCFLVFDFDFDTAIITPGEGGQVIVVGDGGPPDPLAAVTIRIAPDTVVLTANEPAQVHVTLSGPGRGSLKVLGLPTSIESPAVDVTGKTEADLTLLAAGNASATAFFTAQVAFEEHPATAVPLQVRVRGAAGESDPTFGDSDAGFAFVRTTGASDGYSLALTADGHIVAAGSEGSSPTSWLVARFDRSGILDPTFNDGGVHSIAIDGIAEGVLVDAQSMFVVGSESGADQVIVVRLDAKGMLDTTFGNGTGIVRPAGAAFRAHAAAFDGSDLLVAGSRANDTAFRVVRLSRDGMVKSTLTCEAGKSATCSGVLPEDGGVVLSGTATPATLARSDLVVARLLADGAPRPAFGDAGVLLVHGVNNCQQTPCDTVGRKVVAAGGGFIVVGSDDKKGAFGIDESDMFAVRTDATGSDVSFGNGGKARVSAGQWKEIANAAVVQRDGRVVLAGFTQDYVANNDTGSHHIAVVRLTTGGSVDPTFAGNTDRHSLILPKESKDFVTPEKSEGRAIAIDPTDPQGSAIVVGWRNSGGVRRMVLVRVFL